MRFLSLGKDKQLEIFGSSLTAACLLFMFVFLPACRPWNLFFCMFSTFLSICFPVCQHLCLSLHVHPFIASVFFFFIKSTGFLHVIKIKIFTRGFCFSWRNLETIPDMPAWIQPARHLFAGQDWIGFQDCAFTSVCEWVSECVCKKVGS